MKKDKIEPSKGRFLISAPFLGDFFKRTVILLTEHNENGSVGFVLNKPLKIKLNEVIEDFPKFDAKVFLGGPVQAEILNVIHKDSNMEGGIEIIKGVYWGLNYETLKISIETGALNPSDYKFFLGYSGWSPNQLDEEIKRESWFVDDSKNEYIFSDNTTYLWRDVLKNMGKEYTLISTFPEDPSVN